MTDGTQTLMTQSPRLDVRWRRAIAATALMLAAVVSAVAITPHTLLVETEGKIDIGAALPSRFGQWRLESNELAAVVNPTQSNELQRLYSQIVSRAYIRDTGERIMLSIAYGENQRDGNDVHYPEVCYPAQGFQVTSNEVGTLTTSHGTLKVRRLQTHQLQARIEPVTYWVMIGRREMVGGADKKMAELHYALQGLIPDGLLFRVSSIDAEASRAFAYHDEFVRSLTEHLTNEARERLMGLTVRSD